MWKYKAIAFMTIAALWSCSGRLSRVSTRDIGILTKNKDPLSYGANKLPTAKKDPIYIKKSQVKITKTEQPNFTGSLTQLDSNDNYLFIKNSPHTIGKHFDFIITSNREPINAKDSPDTETEEDKENPDELKELFKDFPELVRDDKQDLEITRLKMKAIKKYPNGDYLVEYKRNSLSDAQGQQIIVRARISGGMLKAPGTLSTDDLSDIYFVENAKNEVLERKSTGWEDEYTLRINGFSEAKSKMAQNLVRQKRELDKVKEKMATKLKSVGKERKQMAKERDGLLENLEETKKASEEMNTKLTEKAEKIKEQSDTIDTQKQQILDLQTQLAGEPTNEEG